MFGNTKQLKAAIEESVGYVIVEIVDGVAKPANPMWEQELDICVRRLDAEQPPAR